MYGEGGEGVLGLRCTGSLLLLCFLLRLECFLLRLELVREPRACRIGRVHQRRVRADPAVAAAVAATCAADEVKAAAALPAPTGTVATSALLVLLQVELLLQALELPHLLLPLALRLLAMLVMLVMLVMQTVGVERVEELGRGEAHPPLRRRLVQPAVGKGETVNLFPARKQHAACVTPQRPLDGIRIHTKLGDGQCRVGRPVDSVEHRLVSSVGESVGLLMNVVPCVCVLFVTVGRRPLPDRTRCQFIVRRHRLSSVAEG
mmetsp:Transcript_24881/g.57577  ORF Transcript_24881/g.57577 Transcript_24881/m.57577 type:complete len:261 (-) Transcript_24881:1213-1995(-)